MIAARGRTTASDTAPGPDPMIVMGRASQAIARHADLDVTMSIYAHAIREALDRVDGATSEHRMQPAAGGPYGGRLNHPALALHAGLVRHPVDLAQPDHAAGGGNILVDESGVARLAPPGA